MTQGPPTLGAASALQCLALLPPVLLTLVTGPAPPQALATALIVTLLWELLFTRLRRRPISWHGAVTAMTVFVLLPADIALWELALALSLGVTLSELVFGGRGFGFLSPAAATLAFLVFSFPHVALAEPGRWIALATMPGAALLLATGLINWRVPPATAAGFAIAAVTIGTLPGPAALGGVFGLVFLVSDPYGAAATNPGRWLYGALCGGLVALFGATGLPAVASAALVFATLMGNVLAPMIDQLVIGAEVGLRKWRRA